MKKIKILLLIIILPFLHTACNKTYFQHIKIKDVQTKETVILKKQPSKGTIQSIRIKITGHLKGEANISLILNNKKYKTNKLKDDFSFNWDGDWYSDNAEIVYEPINAKNGKVLIEYEFKNI